MASVVAEGEPTVVKLRRQEAEEKQYYRDALREAKEKAYQLEAEVEHLWTSRKKAGKCINKLESELQLLKQVETKLKAEVERLMGIINRCQPCCGDEKRSRAALTWEGE